MADNTSTFVLKVKTEGMDQAQSQSQAIRNNLEGAQRAASGTATGRVARSAAAQPTGRAGASAGVFTGPEVEDYNRASGAAGKAGGTARDFADQARGLGGLVRLYATVAANAFAAAAAFGALSRAMDTSNMVKGLDQLGAASGVALGNLSKRLFLATDGAVSLREAMEATAKASGAGLSSDQILKLGDVAKKASQTLGVNMTDALSRLSRGITKLEPELLDELGIFVKIDDAASKYALSVGKSTSALTDFERRQAFANAVLEQGNKKFGEVNIDINPYTKLAATFQNLTQTILEFVNKGLAPIAKIFADNSVLLGAAFAFIATKVLKMAIPALGEWQTQLVKTAETAKEKAQAINTAFGEAWVDRWENRLKLPELRAGVKEAASELKKMGLASVFDKTAIGEGYNALIKGEALSAKQIAATKLAITSNKEEIMALSRVQTAQSAARTAELQKEIIQLEAIIALEAKRATLSLAETNIGTAAEEQPGFFSGEAQRNRRAKGASTTAIALAELAAIPGQTMEKGFGDAMKNMKANLEKQGVGFVKRWSTLAVGALASATTAIGTFIASITAWIGVFMAVGFAIYGALKYFSATKKESELTSEAITRLDDASKSAQLTLEKLSMSKDPLESLSVQTIQAKANALKELGDSGALAVKRAFDEISKMNAGDQFLNWVSKLWGGDVQTKLSEGLADSIKNSFKLAEDTKLTQEAKKSIEGILGTSIQSANLEQVIKKVAASGDDGKLKQIVKIIESMGNAAAISAAKGTELKESIAKVTTGIQEFNRSIVPTDSLSKIAQDSAVAAQKLGMALADPVQALTAMRDVSGSVDMLSIFPADVAKNLMSYNDELNAVANSVVAAKNATASYDKEIENLNKEIKKLGTSGAGVNTKALVDQYKQQIEAIEAKKLELKAEIDADTGRIKGVFDQAVRSSLILSAEQMAARLAVEMNKAQSVVKGAMAGLLGDTVGGIRMRAELEKRSIDANMEATKQSFALASKMEELKIEMERKRLQDEKFNLQLIKKEVEQRGGSLTTDQSNRLTTISTREAELDKMQAGLRGRGMGQSSVSLANAGASADVVALQQRFEQLRVTLASGAASQEAVKIKAKFEEDRKSFELEQKRFQLSIDTANSEKERAGVLSTIYGIENQSATLAKIAADVRAQDLADEKARNALVFDTDKKAELYLKLLNEQTKSKKALTAEQEKELENFRLALVESGAEVDRFDEALKIRTRMRDINNEILRISSQTAAEQKKQEFEKQRLDTQYELQEITSNSLKQELDSLVSLGRVDQTYAANRIASLSLEAQQIQYNKQLSDIASQKRIQDLQAEDQYRKAIAAGGNEIDAMIEWGAQTAKNNALTQDRIDKLNASNTLAVRSIELTRQGSLETAKQNEEIKRQAELLGLFTGIANTLSEAFGKTGEVLSKFVTTLGDISAGQEKYNTERAKQAKIISDIAAKERESITAEDVAQETEAKKKLGDLDRKRAKDEISDNAKLMGSVKNLFKEKTTAYKVFGALEKALHIARLAMDVKELVSKITTETGRTAAAVTAEGTQTATAGAGFLARAGLYVTEIFAKVSSQLGIFGPPIAAAIVAAIGLSAFGGGKKSAPGGFTAEEQQKVEGTGRTYVDGKLVDREGGDPGDREALADSLSKALETVNQNTFENKIYTNKTLPILQMIERNTRDTAYAVYNRLGPNAEGSLTSTIPTGKTRENYLGSTGSTLAGAGLGVAGGMAVSSMFAGVGGVALMSGTIGAIGAAAATALGGLLLPGLGLLLAKPIGKLVGKIIGGETTQTIEDFGLLVTGTFDQITEGAKGAVQEFANVRTEIDGGWFGKDRVRYSMPTQEAPELIKEYIGNIFEGFRDIIKSTGTSLQKDVSGFLSTFKFPEIKVSSEGKTAEEFARALNAELSVAFNTAAKAAFPELAQFKKSGEEFGETIIRVVNNLETANYAMRLMGRDTITQQVFKKLEGATVTNYKTIPSTPERRTALNARGADYSTYIDDSFGEVIFERVVRPLTDAEKTIEAVRITEALVDGAGGLDKFVSQTQFFADNFLTEAERLAPVQEDLITRMDELGLSSIDTMAEFKNLVNSVDLTTKEGRTLYQNLMDVQYAFAAVHGEAEELLRSKVLSQQIEGLKLLGRDQEALTLQRNEELAELAKFPPAHAKILIANQKYLYALEDEKTIKEEIAREQEKLNTFLNRTKDQQSTIFGLLEDTKSATDLKRSRELQDIIKNFPADQATIITANQNYIYALEDEQDLKKKLIAQRDKEKTAIKSTIDSLKTSITTLKDYRTSLLTGNLSTLTPEERYGQTRAEFMRLQAIALGPAGTEAEKAAQLEAVNKLPQAANSFLEASRTMFASGANYTSDFNLVTSIVDKVTSGLENQKTNAELQLDELERSTSFLDSIDTNTATTADLLTQYFAAQGISARLATPNNAGEDLYSAGMDALAARGAAATAKSNALAQGITLVENLPSVTQAAVTGTAQVAQSAVTGTAGVAQAAVTGTAEVANAAINGMLSEGPQQVTVTDPITINDNNIVTELRTANTNLNRAVTELENLRRDQQQQTGAIITSNAQVVNANAQTVSNAVNDTQDYQYWYSRQVVGMP
jgi:hypothetical protein